LACFFPELFHDLDMLNASGGLGWSPMAHLRCCCHAKDDLALPVQSEINPTPVILNPDAEEDLRPGDFLVEVCRKSDEIPLFLLEVVEGLVFVSKPLEGIEVAWNSRHADSSDTVTLGDRVVSVNGEATDTSKMLFDIAKCLNLRMVLRHARQICVRVDKARRMLGMSVLVGAVKVDLKISRLETGVVTDWNQSHPKDEIKVGDRIVKVNGISGDAPSMLRELARTRELSFLVRRLC